MNPVDNLDPLTYPEGEFIAIVPESVSEKDP